MIHRKHFDDAAFLLAMLRVRQRSMGVTDVEMQRRTGLSRGTFEKWSTGERQGTLKCIMAFADALGMKIEMREKP